jgi:acetolactate synthase-1/2/3 large subunit
MAESAARPLDTAHRMRDNKLHTVFVDCMQCTDDCIPSP